MRPDRVLLDGKWDFVGGGITQRIVQGRRPLPVDRGGVDPGQGHPRPHHAGRGRALSAGGGSTPTRATRAPATRRSLRGRGTVGHPPPQLGVHGRRCRAAASPASSDPTPRARCSTDAGAGRVLTDPCADDSRGDEAAETRSTTREFESGTWPSLRSGDAPPPGRARPGGLDVLRLDHPHRQHLARRRPRHRGEGGPHRAGAQLHRCWPLAVVVALWRRLRRGHAGGGRGAGRPGRSRCGSCATSGSSPPTTTVGFKVVHTVLARGVDRAGGARVAGGSAGAPRPPAYNGSGAGGASGLSHDVSSASVRQRQPPPALRNSSTGHSTTVEAPGLELAADPRRRARA